MKAQLIVLAICTILLGCQVARPNQSEKPELKLTCEGPSTVFGSKEVEYQITIANEGNATAKMVQLIAVLPTVLEYVRSIPNGIVKPNTKCELAEVAWKLGDIPSRTNVSIRFNLAVGTPHFPFAYITSLKLLHGEPSVMVLEESIKLQVHSACRPIEFSVFHTVNPCAIGETTVYMITLSRGTGWGSGTNIKVVCNIPPELEFVSAKGPVSATFDKRKVVFNILPELREGEKVEYSVTCRALQGESAKFMAFLNLDGFDQTIMAEEETTLYK